MIMKRDKMNNFINEYISKLECLHFNVAYNASMSFAKYLLLLLLLLLREYVLPKTCNSYLNYELF